MPADVDEYDYGLKTAEETKDHDNVKSKLKKLQVYLPYNTVSRIHDLRVLVSSWSLGGQRWKPSLKSVLSYSLSCRTVH